MVAKRWIVRSMSLMMMLSLSAKGAERDLFDRDNLVAWCIVPFDAAHRSSEERGRMLERLGLRQLAYDWRAEHIAKFDEEVDAMKRHGVRISAWWMAGPDLNETNQKILDVVRRHGLKMQFWVMAGDPVATLAQADKVRAAANAIRPLAEEAAKLGCQVGLYNHGGWFGEPENQLAILSELKLDNVGMVYNLHHGHAHLDRFAEILAKIKPHLLAINLNGMTARGEQLDKKILPIGAGDLDLELLRTIRASGYQGPIGILNHTDLDAEARLADNLAGLDWLMKQLNGGPAGQPPKMKTYKLDPMPTGSSAKELNRDEQMRLVELIAEAKSSGVASRGAAVFSSQKFACISCHRVGKQGGTIGPELTKIGSTQTANEIVESLLWPKRKVKPEFVAVALATENGTVHQGYVVREEADTLVLREAASCELRTLAKSDVVGRRQLGTLMPEGLTAAMSQAERRDVVRFLFELGRPNSQGLEDLLGYSHEAAQFTYQAAPLEPTRWRYARHPVNRDRLYDFYAKEADYFRNLGNQKVLMPAYPGLDGGRLGHWGNQNEDTWRDDRWKQMESGSIVCGIFQNGAKLVGRGVCIRLGGPDELAACFNPETLTYEAVWQGGFLKRSAVRHGFVDALAADGQAVRYDVQKSPSEPFKYRGYYRYGDQVVFAYDAGGRRYLDSPELKNGQFVSVVAPADQHPLKDLTRGGPSQWPDILETKGTLGTGGEYVIDSIPLPFKNPWNALMFVGGHDFLADGSAMLCTMQGDVWHVTGLDATLEHVRWKRFATGLHHPLGLVVANEQVHVLGRNQITRLHDLNHDDEADFYECFSQAYLTSTAGHDFICGLERDGQGSFFTVSGNQGLLRISPDGAKAEVLATGFRNPDGLGLLPDGSITVPCSEGEWTATSMICLVQANKSMSARIPPHYGYGGPQGGIAPQLPLVYLPRGLDNSSGGQTDVSSKLWGPLAGQVVHFSYGAGTSFLLLRDEVKGQVQGAVVPLPGDFASGAHRGRFHPLDGQLYVSGMTGWGTYTAEDGSFERVRYTGQPVQLPTAFHVHQNGVRVTFTSPLDSTLAGDAGKQFAQAWNYRYSGAYGSAEYAPSHLGTVGHDRLMIPAVHMLEDGRSMFLEMPDLQPVNQLHLRLQVKAGQPVDLFATVHAMDEPFTEFNGYRPVEKTIAAHPILADLTQLAKPPRLNPSRKPIPEARAIRIEAGKNLTFATRSITVRAGEPVKLTFMNPDVVPHNWVLLKPESLAAVGELVNEIVADPEAANRHYVPESDDVLVYSDIVPAGQDFTIYFRAPEKPGRYPYLCSFPGHWMVMNGQMVVE